MRKYLAAIIIGLASLSTITARASLSTSIGISGYGGSPSVSSAVVGQTFTVTDTGHPQGFYNVAFTTDHCVHVSIISIGTLSPNNGLATYIHGCGGDIGNNGSFEVPSGTANDWLWLSTTPGTITVRIDSITPNSGDPTATDTPAPTPTSAPTATAGPTATALLGAATLPGIVPSPGLQVTPLSVHFPTAPAGLLGQGGLYTAPTGVPLSNINYGFGFSLDNEVALANGAISMYETANSGGAINIMLIIFMAFAGIAMLFALIKKLGDR